MEFIVEGVNKTTQADVRLLIRAASKEAATAKAQLSYPDLILTRITRETSWIASLFAGYWLSRPRHHTDRGADDSTVPLPSPSLASELNAGGLLVAATILGVLCAVTNAVCGTIILIEVNSWGSDEVIAAASVTAAAVAMAFHIPCLCFYFQLWSLIPTEHARTTPVRAVWCCFIPVWNAYWIFVLVHGLSVDMTKWLSSEGLKTFMPIRELLSKVVDENASVMIKRRTFLHVDS